MQCVSKRALEWNSKCYSVPNITIAKLFLKRSVLLAKAALNRNYPRPKLGVFCYIMVLQNFVHVPWINVYKLSKL
jgi:hypothetical protein